jgi:hypothetical protein
MASPDGGEARVAFWRRGAQVATALDLVSGGVQEEPARAEDLPSLRRYPPHVLRDSPWRVLERRLGGVLHGVALSADRRRVALLHAREGLLVYDAGDRDPAEAARALALAPALHLPEGEWLSSVAALASDASAALTFDPWTTPGAQRWSYVRLTDGAAHTFTTRLPDLRGWHADAALQAVALWTEDRVLVLLDPATGTEAARFHLPGQPVQAALAPDGRFLCCALPSQQPAQPGWTAWVFA